MSCLFDDLPFDVLNIIFYTLRHEPTFLIISFVSMNFYRICASIGKELNINKQISGDKIVTMCNKLALGGNTNLLEWTVDTFYRNDHTYRYNHTICINAAKMGHTDLLMWAINKKYDWSINTVAAAAKHGRFETVKWLHNICVNKYKRTKKMITSDTKITTAAVEGGHLEILMWLIDNDYKMNTDSILEAVKNGHLDILIWIYDKYDPEDPDYLNSMICTVAAGKNQLEVLIWLREKDYQWDTNTSNCAAENGHLELLIWAIDNGCPINYDKANEKATRNGHMKIVNWIREKK